MPQKDLKLTMNYGYSDKEALELSKKVRKKIESDVKKGKNSADLLQLSLLIENVYYSRVEKFIDDKDIQKFLLCLFLVFSVISLCSIIIYSLYILVIQPTFNLVNQTSIDKKVDILLLPIGIIVTAFVTTWIDRKFIRKKETKI